MLSLQLKKPRWLILLNEDTSGLDWFMRRHSYGPGKEYQGMTEPDAPLDIDRISINRVDRTNELLEQILRIHMHDKITEFDIDISDSVLFTLASYEAAEISYKVPSNYVMLLQNYFTTLSDDTLYYVYLDDELFQRSADMTYIGAMGLAVASQVTFKMYVLNVYGGNQTYTTSIKASVRRMSHWDYPVYSYKKPV